MPGSFDYSSPSGGLTAWADTILVCRYDKSDEESPYTLLPNVFCEQLQFKESAEPPTAQFSYITDDTGFTYYPSQFEDLWPINSQPNPYKVQCGDRLVCLWVDPEGDYRVVWDGFAQLPQTDLAGRSQEVSFVGVHVSVRLWDVVVTGRWQRDGSDPSTPGDPFQTDLPTRFNPDDSPNCTPKDADEEDEESGAEWPVFIEPKLQDVDGETVQTYWDLSKFARYILWYYNDETYVDNPDFNVLDDLLSCRSPKKGKSFYDPSDSSTFDESPIIIRDFDATNRPPMEVLEQQLSYAGFRMRFVCEGTPSSGGSGGTVVETPHNYIEIYRFDAAGPTDPKVLFLQAVGNDMDPSANNVAAFSAQNDFHAVANQWSVETKPVYYEVGVLLAPGFKPAAGDGVAPACKQWLLSNQDSATKDVREKYRLWIADECGEGHWDIKGKEWVTDDPLDLTSLFADEDKNPDGEHVFRYRPGLNTLFSPDLSNRPLRTQIQVSRDYVPGANAGNPPCLWNGSGTWQTVGGGWRLLRDRLGIFIDIEDPAEWGIGKPDMDPAPVQDGVLNAVLSICDPVTPASPPPPFGRQQQFYLMLVTVIPGDRMIDATAFARPSSPYPFTVARQVDAKDHFQRQIVDLSSPFIAYATGADAETETLANGQVAMKDDTPAATTYAEQMRAAHEFPPIAASVTIPWFSTSYRVGDRIAYIAGRNVSLQANAGAEQSEAPSYPYVVGVSWDFSGDGQRTVLQLSDRRTEPSPFHRSHSSGRSG